MHEAYSRFGFAAGVIATLGAAGCAATEGAATPEAADDAVRVVNVEIVSVTLESFTEYIRVTGQVEAMYDITLSAEESGAIERFLVEKGRRVRRGQVIAVINSDVLAAQVAEARATAELAREQFERQRRLWEDEQIGSEIAFLQTRSVAEAAGARLRTLQARLERTKIRAPVSGIFDEKFIEIGEMVSPGTPVARVVAIRQVKITGGIPERLAVMVRPGDAAQVWFDVLPGEEYDGEIGFVGSSVDPRNRTVPIEVVMDNPNGVVKPRMIANLRVVRVQRDSVMVVPQQVLQRTEDGYKAYVVAERNGHTVAESRNVVLGPSYRNRVVVESGLAVGDRLITLGSQLVDAGTRVRVVGVESASVDARKDSE